MMLWEEELSREIFEVEVMTERYTSNAQRNLHSAFSFNLNPAINELVFTLPSPGSYASRTLFPDGLKLNNKSSYQVPVAIKINYSYGMKKSYLCFLLIGILFSVSCKKTVNYQSDQLTDYLQLQIGKYIIYRMDSLQFINFGTQDTIVSHLVKDVVTDSVVDGIGRPSWRVMRYISDTSGTGEWEENEAYLVTPTRERVEVVENNLRFIKLALPIVNDFSWKGNSYIETETINSDYRYLSDWDYTYDSVGMPFILQTATIPNCIVVHQRDAEKGSDTSLVRTRDYSVEVYSKGIGLIYKDFLHSDYQPPNVSSPVGTTSGYGLRLSMIDHN